MMAMLGHLLVAPVVLPLLSAAIIVTLGDRRRPGACRAVSIGSCLSLVLAAVYLLGWSAIGQPVAYPLGNWPAPYGIVLVLDRLSALMLLLTALLAVAVAWFAAGGWDARGRHFHALFQLQLMGLNGAFLTGDLFNLFVFFELLLIASYGLMLHGGGARRQRATLHYLVCNLVASTLFLVSASLLYGVTGTLNMADLALQVAAAPLEDASLLRSAGLVLLVVFAVKAAVLPLGFWLRDGYASASPPVACLFALMTKVGIYAIVRTCTLMFGAEAGGDANLAGEWLVPVGIATLAMASIAALACRNLAELAACLVVTSVGSMLIGAGVLSAQGLSAALFYMVHSTFAVALLFLLAGEIAHERGALGSDLLPGPPLRPGHLAPLFLFAAIAVSGLPPGGGFIAKVGILQGAIDGSWTALSWMAIFASSLLVVVALARSGSMLFWRPLGSSVTAAFTGAAAGLPRASAGPSWFLATALLLLLVGARPVQQFMDATGAQLLDPAGYVDAVIQRDLIGPPDLIGPGDDRLRTRGGVPEVAPSAAPSAAPPAAAPGARGA
ncbi:MAG: monovalent cation/H+ antiporter subunit D [Betaproteobacteria bacterium]|nr:monovalent cation/H+ antiporter subunit D [Betaproteobacteria bacterium]